MSTVTKTPVSFLQELCLKKNIIPEYHVVDQGTPSHLPSFVYEVKCDERVTQGHGRSKKEAKHAAAEKMLQQLRNDPQFNLINDSNQVRIPDDRAIPSPYEHKINTDAVGPLSDFCADYKLPCPIYQEIREEGPAHARLFTHRCFVESLGVEATDRQKKQAKQQVALQMLNKLKSAIELRVMQPNSDNKGGAPFINDRDFQEMLKNFPNCQLPINTKYHPSALIHPLMTDFTRVQNYKKILIEAFSECDDSAGPEHVLDFILQKIDVKYGIGTLDCVDENMCLLILNIDLEPQLNLCEYGDNYVEAARKASTRALNFLKLVCTFSEFSCSTPS